MRDITSVRPGALPLALFATLKRWPVCWPGEMMRLRSELPVLTYAAAALLGAALCCCLDVRRRDETLTDTGIERAL